MKNVTFIKNPVGKYNLSYDIGETVSLPDSLADDIIEDKIGVLAGSVPAEEIPAPPQSFKLGDEEKKEEASEEGSGDTSLADATTEESVSGEVKEVNTPAPSISKSKKK